MSKTWTTKEALEDTTSYRLVHTYRISNSDSGLDLGTFLGRGPKDALDEMHRQAGYDSFAHCLECTELTGEDLIVEDLGI